MVDEFVTANNLVVLNQASEHTIYASTSDTTNIDMTMSTPRVASRICD